MRLLFLTRHDILTFLQPMTGRAVSEAKPPLSGNCAGRHAAAPNRQRYARLGETGVWATQFAMTAERLQSGSVARQ